MLEVRAEIEARQGASFGDACGPTKEETRLVDDGNPQQDIYYVQISVSLMFELVVTCLTFRRTTLLAQDHAQSLVKTALRARSKLLLVLTVSNGSQVDSQYHRRTVLVRHKAVRILDATVCLWKSVYHTRVSAKTDRRFMF